MNPLVELQSYGQSFWYDNIRRKFLLDGTIKELIDEDGLRGMTSNPSIFDQAIGSGDDYNEQITQLSLINQSEVHIYEELAIFDIKLACDLFSRLYRSSKGGDGYVSLEVSPYLARDTSQTVEEAMRLFATVDRPNLMIKVPATEEGIPAIRELIGRGVNVNVTLMFSMDHYLSVADAYVAGLEDLLGKGGEAQMVASVASFFVSRVDTDVDRKLSAINDPAAEGLLGKTAIANSKIVYKKFKEIYHGSSFEKLVDAGARRQRLLWASTSTKNPDYQDTMYIDQLIGPETVNTMPPNTIDAFRDHGHLSNTLESESDEASAVLDKIAELGIDLKHTTDNLQTKGVRAFSDSFDQLMTTLKTKIAAA